MESLKKTWLPMVSGALIVTVSSAASPDSQASGTATIARIACGHATWIYMRRGIGFRPAKR